MQNSTIKLPLWHQPVLDYQRQLDEANAVDPRERPWGYFARHHGFACGPISIGVFMWYPTQAEMLQGLVQGEVQIEYEGEVDPDEAPAIEAMQAIADRLAAGDLDSQAACEALSKPFNFLTIEWLGRFEELSEGNSPFALEVREDFRESQAAEGDANDETAAISPEEQDDFIDMLNEWGI